MGNPQQLKKHVQIIIMVSLKNFVIIFTMKERVASTKMVVVMKNLPIYIAMSITVKLKVFVRLFIQLIQLKNVFTMKKVDVPKSKIKKKIVVFLILDPVLILNLKNQISTVYSTKENVKNFIRVVLILK